MSKYSKAIAAILGGAVTILVAWGFLEPGQVSEEWIAGIATALAGAAVYLAPKNTE